MRIKHEQIVSQFEPPGMIDPKLLDDPPATVPTLAGDIAATALTYSENGITNRLERLTFRVARGEQVALVGTGYSGKEELAQLIARLNLPDGRSPECRRRQSRRRAPGGSGPPHRVRGAERAHLLGNARA